MAGSDETSAVESSAVLRGGVEELGDVEELDPGEVTELMSLDGSTGVVVVVFEGTGDGDACEQPNAKRLGNRKQVPRAMPHPI